MGARVFEVSAVVVAKEHNPTILHPAFLVGQGIVPEDWRVQEGPVCTPLTSMVRYENGIRFTVDGTRLVVEHDSPGRFECRVADLAAAYVQALPHVHYTAVGLNFGMFIDMERPVDFLLDRFVRQEGTRLGGMAPRRVNVQLAYDVDDATLNLVLSPHEDEGGEGEAGLVVKANYHHAVGETPNVERVVQALGTCVSRGEHFEEVVGRLVARDAEKNT